MKYLSVCSGIEAATVAWKPLGWSATAFAEIERFPCAVLKHHYPTVPNWGDLTRFKEWPDATFDVLVGGTPCQSFSVAGLRAGLDDPRGNLALTYLAVADRYRPKWVVWENVPGVLSSNSGRDFGAFVGGLRQLGYLGGWRILDAQYFGLAQRRKRVFVVGHLGDWRRAAAVLFERESLSGHPAPSRETGEGITGSLASRASAGGGNSEGQRLIAHSLKADGFDASPTLRAGGHSESHANGGVMPAVAFNWQSGGDARGLQAQAQAQALSRSQTPAMQRGMQVRRLTPRECERLQGFPDDYTLIPYRGKPAADGPRYKALGNSMAVPVMAWIGRRIALMEQIDAELRRSA